MLWSWLILTLAVAVSVALLPGFQVKGGTWGVVKVAAIFGLLNWLLGELVFVLLGIGTLGIGFLVAFLTRLIATALLLKLTAAMTKTLDIDGFGTAFVAALIISGAGTAAEWALTLV
jgi:putative membrane protein